MLQVSTRGSKRKAAPPDPFEQSDGEGESRLTAATPMENPYCSCKLTRVGEASDLAIPTVSVAPSWEESGSWCVKCITLEPGGVTIFNSIALIHPARTGAAALRWRL